MRPVGKLADDCCRREEGFARHHVARLTPRLASLDDRKEILSKQLESSNAPPPLLHPGMAELYRNEVTELARALEHPDGRSEAVETSAVSSTRSC